MRQRRERLTLAAEELTQTGAKVIDIALRYGYDSPESFTRAFTRFHGVTPTQARRGGSIKSFSRLSVKLILSGGNTMDYRIEKKDAFKLICKKIKVNKPQGDTATADISAFWAACSADGSIEKLCKYGSYENLHGLLGVCFSGEMEANCFPYAIGAEYNGAPIEDSGLDVVDIPAFTYAVFTCKGRMPDAFKDTYRQICTEFFPQSGYEYGSGIELEVYPSADVNDPNYYCEIWVAVKDK